ncbi:MAG: tyrosine recombinase XerC [Oscillospiraceae bacterium]|jgi:site-specific recombinase XerD|nr:tyrosine recombinase XerC [Oscillospiraceae bacterium]
MKRDDFHTLPPLVRYYLDYLTNLSKADLTILEYASDLRCFFAFIVEHEPALCAHCFPGVDYDAENLSWIDGKPAEDFFGAISVQIATEFLAYCRTERDNNPRTRARKTVSINRFFRWLVVSRHILESNPMEELTSPKIDKTLPKYLSLEECRSLLDAVEGDYRERDSCMLILFLNCGMRLSELCGINLPDIRLQEGTLRIRGKGSKERVVYLNHACIAAIGRYLRVRPQDSVQQKDRDALFISRNNRRINQRSVELMLEKYLKLAGLDGRGYSVHKLRHTAATLLYQNDVDVLQLKEILGHENLTTTEIYTHLASRQLREAVEKNPLAMEGVQPDTDG